MDMRSIDGGEALRDEADLLASDSLFESQVRTSDRVTTDNQALIAQGSLPSLQLQTNGGGADGTSAADSTNPGGRAEELNSPADAADAIRTPGGPEQQQQRQQQLQRISDFASGADRAVVRGGWHESAMRMTAQARMDEYNRLSRLPRNAGTDHQINDVLIAHFDSARTAAERNTALRLLGDQVQRGNSSAIFPKMALTARGASMAIVDAQMRLENPNTTAQQRSQSLADRRAALSDLIAVATLADRENRLQAQELIGDLRRGPLRLEQEISRLQTRVTLEPEQRAQEVRQETILTINAPLAEAERHARVLDRLSNDEAQREGRTASRGPVALARTSISLRQILANFEDPTRVISEFGNISRLAGDNQQAQRLLSAIDGTAAGHTFVEAIRSNDTQLATQLLANNAELRDAIRAEVTKTRQEIARLGQVNPEALSRVLAQPELLDQALQDSRELDQRTRRQLDENIETFLRRGAPAERLLGRLITSIRQREDGSVQISDISPVMQDRLRSNLDTLPASARPLVQRLLEVGRLDSREVTALRAAGENSLLPARENALRQMMQLSAQRLGRFGGNADSAASELQTIQSVQALHEEIDNAIAALRSDRAGAIEKRGAKNAAVDSIERFFGETAQNSLHSRLRNTVANIAELQGLLKGRSNEEALRALVELKSKLPDGTSELNELRAARIVRNITPETSVTDLEVAAGRLRSEITAERGGNTAAGKWLAWVEATASVRRFNEAVARGDSGAAGEALNRLAEANTPESRSRLAMVVHSLNHGDAAEQNRVRVLVEGGEGKPVYPVQPGAISSQLRLELGRTALRGLLNASGSAQLDTVSATALAGAYGRAAETDQVSIRRMMSGALNGDSAEAKTAAFGALITAMRLDGTNSLGLVDSIVRGAARSLPEFYGVGGEIYALARQGNPAALTVVARIAAGEIDSRRDKPSNQAGQELLRLAEDRQHSLPAAQAIIRAYETAGQSGRNAMNLQTMRILGRFASSLDAEESNSASSQVVRSSLQILRQEAANADRSPERAAAALEGLLSMPRHLTEQDASFIARNIDRPGVATLLDRYAAQLPATVKRALADDLLHVATSGRPLHGGGNVSRDYLMSAVANLPVVADVLTAADVRRLSGVIGVNRDRIPEGMRDSISEAQSNELRSMTGRVALSVLARSSASDARRAAGEVLSSGVTPANLSQREGDALVELYRDGRVGDASVLRSLDRLTRELGIPAPMESLLAENGVAPDRVVDFARRIRERYGRDNATADSVFRTVVQNVQAVDAVSGRDRAVLMGWDRLNREQKEKLGWTEEPSINELCRMGLERMEASQRNRIVRSLNERSNGNRDLADVISDTERTRLLELGRQSWNALSDDMKEQVRWANASRLDTEAVIGQMVNGILAESHNGALTDSRLYNALQRRVDVAQGRLTLLNREVSELNTRRAEAYRELVAATTNGPDTTFSGDLVRLLGTSLPGTANSILVRNNLGGSQRLAFHTDPGVVVDRLAERVRNNGRDPQLLATQERLLNEIKDLTNRINTRTAETANVSLQADNLLMVRNTSSFTYFRNERRTAAADLAAMDLLTNYAGNLSAETAERLNTHLSGTGNETGALGRLRQRGQSQWDSLPDYRIGANGAPRVNSIEVFEAALGLRATVLPTGGQEVEGPRPAANRGLVQLDARIRGQAGDLFLQNSLRTLDADPVLSRFQQLSARVAAPLSELSQLFRAASDGTPYQSLIDTARGKAEMIRETINQIPQDAIRDLRTRISTMERAAQDMRRQGADAQNNNAYAELVRRIESYKQIHDLANRFDDTRYVRAKKDENGDTVLDDKRRPMYEGSEYTQVLRMVETLTEDGIRDATFINNIKRDGPVIAASVAAMAATAAACATFGVATPLAVAAFGALATVVAAEGTREVLHAVNSNGYSGFGQYGDHGSEIGNWYRLTDHRSLQGNLVNLASVYGNYQLELWTNVAAGMLTAGLAGSGANGFGRAMAAQFKNAPNPLHLAYRAERAMLQSRGSTALQSYFREFVQNSFEHAVQNTAFAAVNELSTSAVRDDFLKGPMREAGWAGHQVLGFGLSTTLVMGQGLLSGARMHQDRSEFRFRLRNGISETDFVRFMQREGFIVTRSQTHSGQWEAIPVGAPSTARPLRLVQESDTVREAVRQDMRAARDGERTVVRPTEQVVPAKPTGQVVPGKPTEQVVPVKPTEQVVPAKPTEQVVPGKPTEQAVSGKPTEQAVPGKPTEQVVPGKPTEQAVPGKPTEQVVPGKPTGQVVPGKPTGQVVPGKPTEQAASAKPAEKSAPTRLVEQTPVPLRDRVEPVRTSGQTGDGTPQDRPVRSQRPLTMIELEERPAAGGRLVVEHEGTRIELQPTLDRKGYVGEYNGQRVRLGLVEDGGRYYLLRAIEGASGQLSAFDARQSLSRHYEDLGRSGQFTGLTAEQKEVVRTAIQREYHREGSADQQRARQTRLSNLVDLLTELQQPRQGVNEDRQRRLVSRIVDGIGRETYHTTTTPAEMTARALGDNHRQVNVGQEVPLNLGYHEGWWYGTRRSTYDAPVKLHVDIASAQDLRRVQAVLIPLLETHPVLTGVVGLWKTMDPLFAVGGKGVGAQPTGSGQGSKGFTIYLRDGADVRVVQRVISEALAQHGLGMERPIVSGNSGSVEPFTNRVGTVRDVWPLTQAVVPEGAQARRGFLLDSQVAEEVARRNGANRGQRLSQQQLTAVERQLGLLPDTLAYDSQGRLMLVEKFVPENGGGVSARGLYARENLRDKNGLTNREALYRLYQQHGFEPAETFSAPRQAERPVTGYQAQFGRTSHTLQPGGPEVVLGREPGTNGSVSRQHVAVRITSDGAIEIKDLSQNGTFVNGTRISSGNFVRLRQGDVVTLTSEGHLLQLVPVR